MLVVDCPLAKVVEVADRISRESWELDADTALSCGVAGAVLTSDNRIGPAELFAAADRAQYVAKRERRRTTVVAPAVVTSTTD